MSLSMIEADVHEVIGFPPADDSGRALAEPIADAVAEALGRIASPCDATVIADTVIEILGNHDFVTSSLHDVVDEPGAPPPPGVPVHAISLEAREDGLLVTKTTVYRPDDDLKHDGEVTYTASLLVTEFSGNAVIQLVDGIRRDPDIALIEQAENFIVPVRHRLLERRPVASDTTPLAPRAPDPDDSITISPVAPGHAALALETPPARAATRPCGRLARFGNWLSTLFSRIAIWACGSRGQSARPAASVSEKPAASVSARLGTPLPTNAAMREAANECIQIRFAKNGKARADEGTEISPGLKQFLDRRKDIIAGLQCGKFDYYSPQGPFGQIKGGTFFAELHAHFCEARDHPASHTKQEALIGLTNKLTAYLGVSRAPARPARNREEALANAAWILAMNYLRMETSQRTAKWPAKAALVTSTRTLSSHDTTGAMASDGSPGHIEMGGSSRPDEGFSWTALRTHDETESAGEARSPRNMFKLDLLRLIPTAKDAILINGTSLMRKPRYAWLSTLFSNYCNRAQSRAKEILFVNAVNDVIRERHRLAPPEALCVTRLATTTSTRESVSNAIEMLIDELCGHIDETLAVKHERATSSADLSGKDPARVVNTILALLTQDAQTALTEPLRCHLLASEIIMAGIQTSNDKFDILIEQDAIRVALSAAVGFTLGVQGERHSAQCRVTFEIDASKMMEATQLHAVKCVAADFEFA